MTRRQKIFMFAYFALFAAAGLELKFFAFLPSFIVSRYSGWITLFSLICIILWLTWTWQAWQAEAREQGVSNHPMIGEWIGNKPSVSIGLHAIIGAAVIYLTVTRLAPHLVTSAVGTPGTQDFTVEQLENDRDYRHCIKLVEPPYLAERVCRVPKYLGVQMRRGTRVTIYGKKSWAGIIPESVALKQVQ